MTFVLYMFILVMEGWGICKMNGNLDIIIQHVVLLLLSQFLYKPIQRYHLFNSLCSSNILCFHCWKSNNLYSFEIQLTDIPTTMKTYLMVLVLLSLSPAITVSRYPCRTMSEPTKHKAWEVVPLKYLRIHCTAFQCYFHGFFIC